MPSKEGKHGEALWSSLHTRSSVNIRYLSSVQTACILFYYYYIFFLVENLNCAPRSHPFRSGPDSRSYHKSAQRGYKRSRWRDGKRDAKVKSDFPCQAVWREGSPVTKDDRTLRARARAYCGRHVLFKVTGPPTPHGRPFTQQGAKTWCPLLKFGGSIVVIVLSTTRPLDSHRHV